MKDDKNTPRTPTDEKPGFFKRILNKLDDAMKKKAVEKSQQSSCCGSGSDDGKGGKCC